MGFVEFGSPVTQTDGNERHFCALDCPLDCIRNFRGRFPSQTDEASAVTNSNKCFESRSLTGSSLLLHRHDLHDFIFQFAISFTSTKKMLDNIIFFNTQRESVDQSKI